MFSIYSYLSIWYRQNKFLYCDCNMQSHVLICYLLSSSPVQIQLSYDIIIHTYMLLDDVIKLKHFPRYWPFVRGLHRSPVNSPHKGQWRGALMFSLICAWMNGWVSNREAGDLRRHRAHYYIIVMVCHWNGCTLSQFIGLPYGRSLSWCWMSPFIVQYCQWPFQVCKSNV